MSNVSGTEQVLMQINFLPSVSKQFWGDLSHALNGSFSNVNLKLVLTSIISCPQYEMSKRVRPGLHQGSGVL